MAYQGIEFCNTLTFFVIFRFYAIAATQGRSTSGQHSGGIDLSAISLSAVIYWISRC
jgi:hypothetical protein